MATKTISIDLEAYDRLTGARLGNESFSRVIKRTIRPGIDLKTYLSNLDRHPLGEDALMAIDKHERQRHMPLPRER